MIGINAYLHTVHARTLDQLYALGVRAIRLWVNGELVIKARDAYDFAPVVRDLTTIRNAGMYAYLNWGNVPAFMSDNQLAYGQFSCWVYRQPNDPEPAVPGSGGWRYARPEEKPYCWPPNVPSVDAAQVKAFGRAFAGECADLVDWVGSWNESDLDAFWPPIKHPDYKGYGYKRLVDEVLVPFARGYRSACTGGAALFVGPESATAGGMRMLLELEREGHHRLFDILSGHLYSWSGAWPGDSFDRTADFLKVAEELGDGRPFWDTETDEVVPGAYVAWYAGQQRRFGARIRSHFRHQGHRWFNEGEKAYNEGRVVLTPNDDYRTMQQLLAEGSGGGADPTKRRSVR